MPEKRVVHGVDYQGDFSSRMFFHHLFDIQFEKKHMRMIKNVFNLMLSTGLLIAMAPVQAATTVIDVMAVYTKGAVETYQGSPDTRINHLFQLTNQIYADSGLDLEIRLVKTMMVDYTDENGGDEALRDITHARHAAFANVEQAREEVKADMVIFYRPFKSAQGSCGQAWIVGEGSNGDLSQGDYKKYMYSHIPLNSCGDYATAHELGHNMGLRHSRRQDGEGGVFPFALGHGVDNQFATIMAYQTSFNVDYWNGKIYKFSSPDLDCNGQPCGVDRANTIEGADARYAISITAPQIAGFYSEVANVASSSSSSSVAASKASVSSVAISQASSSLTSVISSSSSSSSMAIVENKPANTGSSATGTNGTATGGSAGSGGGGSVGLLMMMGLMALGFFRRAKN